MSAQAATPFQASPAKWVYLFSELDAAEQRCGSWDGVRGLLGGKGANLADMVRIGVPVPPGFIVSTAACNAFLAEGAKFPAGMWEEELHALHRIEEQTGKRFGDPGFYFTVQRPDGLAVRYVRTMKERLEIRTEGEALRAEHRFAVFGLEFLRLEYTITRKPTAAAA